MAEQQDPNGRQTADDQDRQQGGGEPSNRDQQQAEENSEVEFEEDDALPEDVEFDADKDLGSS